jgi:hypothetical protein
LYRVKVGLNTLARAPVASVEDVDKVLSTGPAIRWAIYRPYMTFYFAGASGRHGWFKGKEDVQKGMETYSLLKGKSADEMIRWRDSKLIDILRVLGWIPGKKSKKQ